MSADRSLRKLPPRPSATTSTYDALTDPGTSVNPVTRVNPGVSIALVDRVPLVNSDDSVTSGNSDYPDNRGDSVSRTGRRPGPPRTAEPRQHLKVRASLAEQLRDAVSFMVDHGQPRTKLNDVLDQAVEQWLLQAKKAQNGGEDFPIRPGSR